MATFEIDPDELNCPACAEQSPLEIAGFDAELVADGVCVTCPSCGFQIAGQNAAQVEAAARILWDYPPDTGLEDE